MVEECLLAAVEHVIKIIYTIVYTPVHGIWLNHIAINYKGDHTHCEYRLFTWNNFYDYIIHCVNIRISITSVADVGANIFQFSIALLNSFVLLITFFNLLVFALPLASFGRYGCKVFYQKKKRFDGSHVQHHLEEVLFRTGHDLGAVRGQTACDEILQVLPFSVTAIFFEFYLVQFLRQFEVSFCAACLPKEMEEPFYEDEA